MNQKEHIQYAVITFLAVIFIFLSHEFIHWLTGELLQYEMGMSLNSAFPVDSKYRTPGDYQLVSLSGPILTLLEMILFTYLMIKTRNYWFFPFVFLCFYMTLLSGIFNLFNPNDLGRVSRYIGIGLYTLPAIAVIIQFFIMDYAVKKAGIMQKLILITVFWGILFSSILILVNQNFKIRIL
ncbi:hypothetical protein [Fulvivirga sedimenti]|uniref:Uncharacterized protein n=1 Tax=Fulvivirga sedimenti TaxID=2879465 RepID=A0A9X1HKC9_9BACT|nr:hypothetical protein [Fulvivirga sedimenti]MCA6073738.1 hypothetical protein [Fulvivirga sedimenti]